MYARYAAWAEVVSQFLDSRIAVCHAMHAYAKTQRNGEPGT